MPLEYRAAAGQVEGVAVQYNDAAEIPGPGGAVMLERIRPGAFEIADVVANIQHDRQRPLARYPDGGLDLKDTPEALRASLSLPDTQDGRDARVLLDRGVLRGLSVEMRVLDDDFDGRTRTIKRAVLGGLGIVDRPAYRLSTAALKRWAEIEDRAAFTGSYEMGQAETVSDAPGRGTVRKRKFQPGAFRQSIEDPDVEIGLLTSRNPQDAVASKRSGTLTIEERDGRLIITAAQVADTAAWRDLQARTAAGLDLALQPVIRADSGDYTDVPEDPADGTAAVRTYTAAKLIGMMISARPKPGNLTSETELRKWALSMPYVD